MLLQVTAVSRIVLIDGRGLAELMIDHGVGVSLVQTYEFERIDSDCFPMEVQPRNIRHGRSRNPQDDE